MEIRQLRYFVSAATHLNFTKAAQECYIVTSSMAQQIAKLEDELGEKLFERSPQGLSLTDAGEFFLPKAKASLDNLNRIKTDMKVFQEGYSSILRIGYSGDEFKDLLIEGLARLHRLEPDMKMDLYRGRRTDLIEGLEQGQLDLIFTGYMPSLQSETIQWEQLWKSRVKLAVGRDHPLAGRRSVSPQQMKGYTVLEFKKWMENDLDREIEEKQDGQEWELYSKFWANSDREILVRSGVAASFWLEGICRPELYPDMVFLDIDSPEKAFVVTQAMAWAKGRAAGPVGRMRDVVQQLKGSAGETLGRP